MMQELKMDKLTLEERAKKRRETMSVNIVKLHSKKHHSFHLELDSVIPGTHTIIMGLFHMQ
jgi:hypothetical protein